MSIPAPTDQPVDHHTIFAGHARKTHVAWQLSEPRWEQPVCPLGRLPATVNYHLNRNCNYRCRHCYAVFGDAPLRPGAMLPREEMFRLVAAVAAAPGGHRKLTFAGGEPTLVPWLPELITAAKTAGLTTMLVTNGTRLTPAYLDKLTHLDWLTWSLDALDAETNRRIGRSDAQGRTLAPAAVLELAAAARARGLRLKINTVVNRHNATADFAEFLLQFRPERWKLLQVMAVAGQNDAHFAGAQCDAAAFEAFVARHRWLEREGIRLVPEPVEAIRGSYAMIDPDGRFFDSASGRHHYSAPILTVGVANAFAQVTFDADKFHSRGGDYEFGSIRFGRSADVREDETQALVA